MYIEKLLKVISIFFYFSNSSSQDKFKKCKNYKKKYVKVFQEQKYLDFIDLSNQ